MLSVLLKKLLIHVMLCAIRYHYSMGGFHIFKLYKGYQIAQNITYDLLVTIFVSLKWVQRWFMLQDLMTQNYNEIFLHVYCSLFNAISVSCIHKKMGISQVSNINNLLSHFVTQGWKVCKTLILTEKTLWCKIIV